MTPTATPTPARPTRPDGSPVRALVVDDEASLGDLPRMALRYEGWDVRTASNGQQALAEAKGFSPDVIVLAVESRPGDTRFVVRLPLESAER